MFHWLLTRIVRLQNFRGKHRLVAMARSMVMSPFICEVSHGLKMELDCYEWTQLHLAEYGTTEPQTMGLIERLLSPGMTFIDVGAHVGYVTLVARSVVGDVGTVVAIEPQPYNCERILRNCELNGFEDLCLHVAAAGQQLGFVKLPQQSRTDKARLSLAIEMNDALALEYEVPLTTIDSVISKNSITAVDLLKIDVEGFEASVLQGAAESISVIKNIIFEALNSSAEEVNRAVSIAEWLRDRNFKVMTVQGDDWDGSDVIPENNLWASKL